MKEFIKQIYKQIGPPRSNESKTRKLFRRQVIDGALEEEEDRRRAVIGFEITRARIRSWSKRHR